MAPSTNTPEAGLSRPPAKLRAALRWTLGLTVAASFWALLSPADTVVSVPTSPLPSKDGESNAVANPVNRDAPLPVAALPAKLAELALEAADRDPFMIPAPPPPPAPPAPPPPAPVPPPTAPPLNYRYLGSMVDPEGVRKVYLARADKDVLIETGSRLDEGYRVESITEDEVQLIYEPLQQRAVIRIPTAQAKP